MFKNRLDASEKLSSKLEKFKEEDTILLPIPRGGLEIAYSPIKKYGFKWDLIIPRKIGAPHNKEVAIGAVLVDGTFFVDEYYRYVLGISNEYIENEVTKQIIEIKRRMDLYKGNDEFPEVDGKTAILIDDGIATGFTIIAAIESIKKHGANKIVIATPVAPMEIYNSLSKLADEVICLMTPENFMAVGYYYEVFEQLTDVDVLRIIEDLKDDV